MRPFTKGIEKRTIMFFSIFVLLFSFLYLRLGVLAKFSGLRETAKSQSSYTLTLDQRRGMIYDANLNPLVNRVKESIYTVLPTAKNMNTVLNAVSESRRESVYELLKTAKPFILKTNSLIETENVTRFYRQQRYEYFQLAPHIIGYLDSEKNGITGIEKSYNEFLSEHTSKTEVSYVIDALGHGMSGIEGQTVKEKEDNAGIVLSIDKDVQAVIQNIGSRMVKKGAIVVMNPYTGEIKGSASFPSFSPLNLTQSISDTENSPMINRAFLPFNVGSTFKIVTTAVSLEEGLSMKDEAECFGVINVSGQSIHCHNRNGHGSLDMLDAMKESCNPYFINLGLKVGGEKLLEMAKEFGFGEGCLLADGIYTADGTLPSKTEMLNPAEVANLSFGQGKLTATPIQVAQMMSAVVNGGYKVYPKLVLGESIDGKTIDRNAYQPKEQIMSKEVASQIQSFLIHSVMVADGQNALPTKVTAGGKTATAQTGRYSEDDIEYEHGWFAGFFPAINPEYVVVVLSEDSGYGNKTAAPVFSKIADALS